MPTLTIELPEDIAAWVKDLVEDGTFPSESAYIEDIVRKHLERINAFLDDADKGGTSSRSYQEIWESSQRRHGLQTASENA
jgi:Arc/MetJ-type ribon-helix-helix transcriptional regulator